MKAVVFTLGCKVNSCESSALMSGLKEIGFTVSDKLGFADLYILNTCAVTAEAEKKSRQAVARVKKYNPDAKIIVCGCAAQKSPKSFLDKGVSFVYGAINKDKILADLYFKGVKFDESNEYYEKFTAFTGSKTRAFIKIQDGCDNFCSYCIIPYLRGRSRSRSIASVENEISSCQAKEIVLTGINVSRYLFEGKDLADLIERLKVYPKRIRLGSLEDVIVDERFLKALLDLPDFADHFHLSLQSGSDKVLKEINRKYTTEEFLSSVALIKKYFPFAAVTTDVIAGYSTETEDDFQKTLDFCERAGFADIHCFEYSPREGTVGAKLKELDKSVKRDRMQRILALKAVLKDRFIAENLGKTLVFLPEEKEGDYTVGYTGNYIKVYVSGDIDDELTKVKLTERFSDGAKAELVL